MSPVEASAAEPPPLGPNVPNATISPNHPARLTDRAEGGRFVVTDHAGRLLTFGAILRIAPENLKVARAGEGARTLAALAASYHGPVLTVSEDGFLTMFLGGRRVWEP
jgi:hypothetical protein